MLMNKMSLFFVGMNERFEVYLESMRFYKKKEVHIINVESISEVKKFLSNVDDFFIFCNTDNLEKEWISSNYFKDKIIAVNLMDTPSKLWPDFIEEYYKYVRCVWHFFGNFKLIENTYGVKIEQKILDKEVSGIGYFPSFLTNKLTSFLKIKERENDIFFSGRLFYAGNTQGRFNAVRSLRKRDDIKKIINVYIDESEKRHNVYNEIKEEFSDLVNGWIERERFLDILSKSKFSLSLFGNWHTGRFMESLSEGSIPICDNIDVLNYPGIKSGVSYISINEHWDDLNSFFDYLIDHRNEEFFEEMQKKLILAYKDFYQIDENKVLPQKGFFEFLKRFENKVPELKTFFKYGKSLEINQNKNRTLK